MTDVPPADPRDALIRDQAEKIAAQAQQIAVLAAAPAERVQHDLHEAECACGRTHVAARPAGVPDSPLPIGPRLCPLAVYLLVFQHVPVERCRDLICDVAGAAVSAGDGGRRSAIPGRQWPVWQKRLAGYESPERE